MKGITLILIFSLLQGMVSEPPVELPMERQFDIYYKGKVAGHLDASKRLEDGKVIYENHSSVKIKMLASLNIKYAQQAVFKNEVLQQAHYTLWVNGHIHRSTEIIKNGSAYQIKIGDDTEHHTGPIAYTAACLLLDEPRQTKRVFSEVEGVYHQMWNSEGSGYQKKAPDGKINYYQYRNGELYWAQLDGGLLTFEIKKRQS